MTEKTYIIEGLDCPSCASGLEETIRQMPGVESARLDFFSGKLSIWGEVREQDIEDIILKSGYLLVKGVEVAQKRISTFSFNALLKYFWSDKHFKLVIFGVVILSLTYLLSSLAVPAWFILALRLFVLGTAGYPIFLSGLRALFINRSININLLMTIAAIGAVVIGEEVEAVMLITLFSISEILESYTNDRARAILGEFVELAPKTALIESESAEKTVSIESLVLGDIVIVKAGERIPVDGQVVAGQSDVNQAPLTGESRLISKSAGDEVLSGSINGQGVLKVRVTRKVEDNTIQRIIKLVTEAQLNKAQKQKFIDTFASYYTPIMVGLTIIMAIVPPLIFREPFWNNGIERGWLHRSLSLLVIGCPCALVISTPVTMISSLIRAAKAGILFKGGIFIEKLSQVKLIAFDKTGTLTKGMPVISEFKSVNCSGEAFCEACDDLLAIACALEKHSNHPLRNAVLKAGVDRGVADRYAPASNLQVRSGLGISGSLNGQIATIGNFSLFEAEHNTPQELKERVFTAEENGQTAMLVCDGNSVRGYLSVADEIRENSKGVIQGLKDLDITSVMLTGDNPQVAQEVSQHLGLHHTYASLLPEDKLKVVKELSNKGELVAMVGDGINDAPALAIADIGIAMGGSGSAQVLETADVVLMGDDLRKLPFAVRLSRFTNRLIQQNIVFSLGVKFLAAVLALFGLTPLWLAVLADMGVSLLVTLNGMRALRFENAKKY